MHDSKFWGDAWQEARRSSSLGPGYGNEEGWKNFWDVFSGHYARRNRETMWAAEDVICRLAAEGVLHPEYEVLDVGCGPGTYTLPLASRCKKVTGLDTAPQMLEELQREADHYGVAERVETTGVDWGGYPDQPSFDLVFAAKTPAVKDYRTLLKMCRVSRHYCCLITFAGNTSFGLRNLLWQEIMGTPIKSRAFDLQYSFNILYREGYLPNLRFFSYSHRHREDIDYLIKHYIYYFKIFGRSGPQVEQKISDFFLARAVNGECEDVTDSGIAVMWWKVKKSV